MSTETSATQPRLARRFIAALRKRIMARSYRSVVKFLYTFGKIEWIASFDRHPVLKNAR
jgi:hypothetical protein